MTALRFRYLSMTCGYCLTSDHLLPWR